MNLNTKQIISLVLVVLGVFVASTAQLNDLLGPKAAHTVVSLSSLLMSILSGALAIVTGQSSTVKEVQAMDGIEKIVINAKANSTLAGLAVDPDQAKIESTPGSAAAVARIAQGS